MRIGIRIAMTGEMLAARHDLGVLETRGRDQSHFNDRLRIGAECAVTNDGIVRIAVDVQHRGHVHVDADRFQLLGDRRRGCVRQFPRMTAADQLARGKDRKALGQAGDPSSFLIDGDQQWRFLAALLEVIGQLNDLVDGLQIPREENDAARFVFLEESGKLRRHARAQEADHEELSDLLA